MLDGSRYTWCENVIGVESSPILVTQAKNRLRDRCDVIHGSLIEPPAMLPADSTALIMDSLPPSSDSRLDRLADVLFGQVGFEAVFCVEAEDSVIWDRPLLSKWAQEVGRKYCYGVADCELERCRAVLFRRSIKSPERRKVRSAYVPEIETESGRRIQISPDQWRGTLETFSRFTVDPRWLIYLPPGLCSIQTDEIEGPLEHPRAAFDYYRSEGISRVVVEFKHMGSRAIAIVCRDEAAGMKRFGVESLGSIYTRNGRPFWSDATPVLAALRNGLTRARFWERFATDWVCLDGEMLPWNLKAENLIDEAHGELLVCGEATIESLSSAFQELAPGELPGLTERRTCLGRYRKLCERYQAKAHESYSFAPFHLIATEGRSYFNQTHKWHMETLNSVVRRAGDPFSATGYRCFSLDDQRAVEDCCDWWQNLSDGGDEGVVVKPIYFVPHGRRGMAQPGIKCRGTEHLRMVYGPEYDMLENRWALARRDALIRRREKHRRVVKQLGLSVEGVERFVRGEAVNTVEECVRGVLCLGQ